MRPVSPYVPNIPGDRADLIMWRSGDLLGFSRSRAIWRFGFLHGSPAAQAYGCHTDRFLFVLADYRGRIHKRFYGFGFELPKGFRRILDAKL